MAGGLERRSVGKFLLHNNSMQYRYLDDISYIVTIPIVLAYIAE
jgi:hypothetical protein